MDRLLLPALAAALSLGLPGCSTSPLQPGPGVVASYHVEIRRTGYGVPNIKARDWRSLGYGVGYTQAEDNLCTLADAFITWRGERSRYFGGEARTAPASIFPQAKNLDSDFFFRFVASPDVLQKYVEHQSSPLRELARGFAAGYNRYLRELRSAQTNAHRACRDEPWVAPIDEQDLYRRMYAAGLAGGYAPFLAAIANAQPPAAVQPAPPISGRTHDLAPFIPDSLQAGGQEGVGSNGIALGTKATGTRQPLLLGNPHWYWRGPDRFYQAHLSIPGQIDVSGATLLGLPLILIGYNSDVAWTHTVSTARRFGVFQLKLASGDPTTYLFDGETRRMTAVPLEVEVKQQDGTLVTASRTLYRSHLGLLVNLGSFSPQLAWSATTAFAIRDINADNRDVFDQYLKWARAKSLDELIAVQKQLSATPWVNTIAIGRNDAQVWYGDIGRVPNVPDDLAERCTPAAGKALAKRFAGVPFLDGSQSACDWRTDADSVQPGALPASRMPGLRRPDYVANMNDSYWLSNPARPLTGYPRVIGAEGSVQSLRTRLGHRLVSEQLARAGGTISSESLRALALDSRALSAELFKDELLRTVCPRGEITVAHDVLTDEKLTPTRAVDVRTACEVLRKWDNTGASDARGAHIWDEFWKRAARFPADRLFAVPFDSAHPLDTPRDLRAADTGVQEAFAVAVMRVQQSGVALDAARGEYLFASNGETRLPLFGGCSEAGYFTVACPDKRLDQARNYSMDDQPLGNSYLQVVTFANDGPDAYTLLAHSQSDDPASPRYRNGTRLYAEQHWVRMPFLDRDVEAESPGSVTRLEE